MYNTLEDFGVELAAQAGYEPNDAVRAQIKAEADSIRSQMPGVPDGEIIATQGEAIRQKISSMVPRNPSATAPTPPVAPAVPTTPQIQTPVADEYKAGMAAVDAQFNPASKQAAQDTTKWAKAGLDIGRALSLGARVAASPQANAQLDAAYAEGMKAVDEPVRKWSERRAEAVSQVEQKIKAGQISAQEVRDQMARIGLEQAIQERKDAATIAAAEADPTSVTSESYRKLALQYAPDLATRLGDRFNTIPASKLKGLLPALKEQYLKMIDVEQKKLESADKEKDRLSREKVAAENNASRERAAAVRASGRGSGGPAQPKVADVLRADKIEAGLDKEQRAEIDKADGARESIRLFDRMGKLIDDGLETGPFAGGQGLIGKAYTAVSPKKQEADQIAAQLVAKMAKTFGAAPSDAEAALIKQANNVMQLDNPGPALKELRAQFERAIVEREAAAAAIQGRKDRVRSTVGRAPEAPMQSVNSGTAVMKDRNGKRYNIPRDKVKEAIADGLLPE